MKYALEKQLSPLPASLRGPRRLASVCGCWVLPGKAIDDLCTASVNAVMTLLMVRTPAKDNGLLPLNVLSAAAVRAH